MTWSRNLSWETEVRLKAKSVCTEVPVLDTESSLFLCRLFTPNSASWYQPLLLLFLRKPTKNPDCMFSLNVAQMITTFGRPWRAAESPQLGTLPTGGVTCSVFTALEVTVSMNPEECIPKCCQLQTVSPWFRDVSEQGSLARGSWPRLASEESHQINNPLLIIRGWGLRDNEQMPTGSSCSQAAGPNEKPTCLESGSGLSSWLLMPGVTLSKAIPTGLRLPSCRVGRVSPPDLPLAATLGVSSIASLNVLLCQEASSNYSRLMFFPFPGMLLLLLQSHISRVRLCATP